MANGTKPTSPPWWSKLRVLLDEANTVMRPLRFLLQHPMAQGLPTMLASFTTSWSSGPGTGASKMYSSCLGTLSEALSGHPKFFVSTLFGVWASQSVMRNVLSSEKLPSSHEQELGPVRMEVLDGMRDAGWEEPEVALAHVVHEGMAALVHRGDARPPLQHV